MRLQFKLLTRNTLIKSTSFIREEMKSKMLESTKSNTKSTQEPYLLISKRLKYIMYLLSKESAPISADSLALTLHTSTRKVYYDLKKLNLFFKPFGLGNLGHTKAGFFLYPEQKQKVAEVLPRVVLIYEKNQRIAYIICKTIFPKEKVVSDQLVYDLRISRTTILSDILSTKEILENYQLTLQNNKIDGYFVSGDLYQKQVVFFKYLGKFFKSSNYRFLNLYKDNTIQRFQKNLKSLLSELNINLKDRMLLVATHFLLNIKYSMVNNLISNVDIKYTGEYLLVEKYFAKLSDIEKEYITLFVLSLSLNKEFINKLNFDESIYHFSSLANELVTIFENISKVLVKNKELLIKTIYQHLKFTFFCYLNSFPSMNLFADEIKKDYEYLYKITNQCCSLIKHKFPYPIQSNEIANISLCFGSFLSKDDLLSAYFKVLIVCQDGIAPSMFFKNQIELLSRNIKVIDVINTTDVDVAIKDKDIDLVISNVKFNCCCPILYISSIPSLEDKKKLFAMATTALQSRIA